MRKILTILLCLISVQCFAQKKVQERDLSPDLKRQLIDSAQEETGWQDDGTLVRLVALTDKVGIGIAVPLTNLHIYSSIDAEPVFTIENVNASDLGGILKFYHNSTSPENDDRLGEFIFDGNDGAGVATTYAGMRAYSQDTSRTAEDGKLEFYVFQDAVPSNMLLIEGKPASGTANITLGGATGTVHKPSRHDFDALAFKKHTNITEVEIHPFEDAILFPDGTDTVSIKLRLSEFFTAIDSIEVWISPTSTTNGTFGFDLQYQIRGYNDAFSESSFDFATVSDTVQLPNPHAAKIFERLVFTNFVSLNPGEFLVLLLIRDNTGEGDISESVYFREMCVYDR